MKQKTKIPISQHDIRFLEELLNNAETTPTERARLHDEYDSIIYALNKMGYDTKGYKRKESETKAKKLRELGYL